jgi:hypothetical protein
VPAPRTGGPTPVPAPEERPLVGRRAERARLRAALGDVTRGSGAVVVLEGEAGIGKTRLAEAATALAAAQGWRVAWSRCADDAGAPALWPWLQLLDQLGSGPLEVPSGNDPDQSRWSLFQDLRSRLQEAAAQAPLLVVLDDVQAADGTSLQLLSLLARHLDGVRLLVLVTVRTVGEALPVAVLECLAALRGSRAPPACSCRASARATCASWWSPAWPVTELGPGARRRGWPASCTPAPTATRSSSSSSSSCCAARSSWRRPAGRSRRRCATCSTGASATCPRPRSSCCAWRPWPGREVDLALLMVAGQLDAEQVITLLEPAVRSGVVSEDDVAWSWRFSHALVQETLVAGLSRLAAARLHARLASALEARGSRDVERLAHHCFAAVPVLGAEPAVRYATAAAVAARQRLAHPEAAAHTRRALHLLGPVRRRRRSARACSWPSATTCCAAARCRRRRRSSARRSPCPRDRVTPPTSPRRPACWGGLHAVELAVVRRPSTPRSSPCCRTSPTAGRRPRAPGAAGPRLLGTLGVGARLQPPARGGDGLPAGQARRRSGRARSTTRALLGRAAEQLQPGARGACRTRWSGGWPPPDEAIALAGDGASRPARSSSPGSTAGRCGCTSATPPASRPTCSPPAGWPRA